MEWSKEEIYGCSLEEYFKKTGIPPKVLLEVEKAKLGMLESNYLKKREEYFLTETGTEEAERLSGLLVAIRSRIERVRRNIKRYESESEKYPESIIDAHWGQ